MEDANCCDNCGKPFSGEMHNLGECYYCSRTCAIEHRTREIIANAQSTAQDEYNAYCVIMDL